MAKVAMERDSRLPPLRRINSVADAQAYVNSIVGALRLMNLPAKDTVVIMQPVFTHYFAIAMMGHHTPRMIIDFIEGGEVPPDEGKPVSVSYATTILRAIDSGKWVIAVHRTFAVPEPARRWMGRAASLDHEMTHLLVHGTFGPPHQEHESRQFGRIGRILFGDEFFMGCQTGTTT